MDLTTTQKQFIIYIKGYIDRYNKPIPKRLILNNFDFKSTHIQNILAQLIRKGYLRSSQSYKKTYILCKTF